MKAGTRLTINPVGGKCPLSSGPQVNLYSPANSSLSEGEVHSVSTVIGWQSLLVVPVGLKPGHYTVEADCTDNFGGVYGTYAPFDISVV